MGTLNDRSGSDPSYPRRPATVGSGGGACVVVGARESRVQGKGRQGTDRRAKTEETPVDSGDQADEAWLLGIQRKLYQWSKATLLRCPSRRAGCITKGARPVRRAGVRNRRW